MSPLAAVPLLSDALSLGRRWCRAISMPPALTALLESPVMSGSALVYLCAHHAQGAAPSAAGVAEIAALTDVSLLVSLAQALVVADHGPSRKDLLLDLQLGLLLSVDRCVRAAASAGEPAWSLLMRWLRGQRRGCEDQLAALDMARSGASLSAGADPVSALLTSHLALTASLASGAADRVDLASPGARVGRALAALLRANRDATADAELRAALSDLGRDQSAPAAAPLFEASIRRGDWDAFLRFERGESPGDMSTPVTPTQPRGDRLWAMLASQMRPLLTLGGSAIAEDIARNYAEPAGKLLRGELALRFAELSGAPPQAALPAAIATEQIHLASLLIDDVLDRSQLRHGRPTLAVRHGDLTALYVARYLCLDSFPRILDGLPFDFYQDLCGTVVTMIDGERHQSAAGAETTFEHYLTTIDRKSAALFAFACRSGARAALFPPRVARAAGVFGRELGLAFQIIDDHLDYFGTPVLGKPSGADFLAGIFTAPALLLLRELREAPAERAWILRSFAGDERDERSLTRLREVMFANGIDAKTITLAGSRATRARRLLARFPGRAEPLRALSELISRSVERES